MLSKEGCPTSGKKAAALRCGRVRVARDSSLIATGEEDLLSAVRSEIVLVSVAKQMGRGKPV